MIKFKSIVLAVSLTISGTAFAAASFQPQAETALLTYRSQLIRTRLLILRSLAIRNRPDCQMPRYRLFRKKLLIVRL